MQYILAAVRAQLTRALVAMVFALLAAIVGVGGLVYVGYALYLALAEVMANATAAAIVGGIALLLMALLLVFARAMLRPPKPPSPPPATSREGGGSVSEAATHFANAIDALTPYVRRNFREAAGVAFVAGFIMGVSPRARRAILDIFLRGGR